jgi:acyl-CoA synthetase (AMP-forming)/AMP-acid ligase II
MNLWDRLLLPRTLSQEVWQWDGTAFRRRTWGEGIAEVRHAAAGLYKRGVRPGDVVATVLTNGPDVLPAAGGAWALGAKVASLPIIARGMDLARYTAQLRRLCALLDARCLVAEDRFLAFMPTDTEIGVDIVGCRNLLETPGARDVSPPPEDETLFIQFSSGTTSEPRGVELTGRAIDAHLSALAEKMGIDPERDSGCSWLPMSHDMGFFGFLMMGWYTGIPGLAGTPERFLGAPRTWFDDCSDFGATITAAPPFALDVAARVERVRSSGKPLKLRLCLVGAEEILWTTLTEAAHTFGPRGLTMEALTPAYGLAEATLAVTTGGVGVAPEFLDVDAAALGAGRVEPVEPDHPGVRRLVSTGNALRDVAVRIEPENSEIVVRSNALGERYFGNPELTAARFRDGELHTGDIGFLHEGRLFVSGRDDDLLTNHGRNVYVQDIERALAEEKEIREDNCAIVDVHAGASRRVTLVAEVLSPQLDAEALAARLYRSTVEACGLSIRDFVFLNRGLFPKTPSGKAQRYRCREIAGDPGIGIRVSLNGRAVTPAGSAPAASRRRTGSPQC